MRCLGPDTGVAKVEFEVLGLRLECQKLEYLRPVWRVVSGSRCYRVRYPEVTFSLIFFPQGERGVKGACGLDGEKGDKVQG